MADVNEEIAVKVKYMPENTLSRNEAKEMGFKFSIDPENEASFPGGPEKLQQYLMEKVIEHIPADSFRQHQLAAVTFTVDEKGQIISPQLFWTSEVEKTDKLLLDAICNMPNWKPAAYADGTRVKQEFAFVVGDMNSCVINLLNMRLK